MLLNRLRSPGLHARIAAPTAYRPRWTAQDRAFWETSSETVRRYWIARGERYVNFSWPSLTPLHADYQRTGDRGPFEAVYHRRRQIVTTFVLAEGFENRGRFIQPLVDAIGRICDEPTWVLPAHAEHPIDMFSAETANMIAWADYLFRHVPAVRESKALATARLEVQRRVIQPYVARDDCWWMALNGEHAGNWTTWCTSNCLGTVLLLETDVERRSRAIEKACRSLDRFVEAYAEDGGCDEGPMYWMFAAGCLFDSLEMLFEASDGAFDLFADPIIGKFGEYMSTVHIHGLYFVNFADSPPQVPMDGALTYRFGARIRSPHMQALGAQFFRLLDRFDPEDTTRLKMYRALRTLPDEAKLHALAEPTTTPTESYLRKLQVAVVRQERRAGQGLVMAAKGGHNNELHNHNDIGNVIVYLDGRPVLIDAGSPQYTKDTFSERRYDIWAMQSTYHNVPLVNGCAQVPGAQSAARDARFDGSGNLASFEVDIAGAYPPDARLSRWTRTCALARSAGTITIQDEFEFLASGNRYEQRFMTPCRPRVSGRDVILQLDGDRNLVMRTGAIPARITLHQLSLGDRNMKLTWGSTLYQVRLVVDGVGIRGCSEIVVVSVRDGAHGASDSEVPLEPHDL